MKRITDATWQCSGYLQGSSHGETSRGHVTRGQIEAKQRHDLSRHRERFCQPCTAGGAAVRPHCTRVARPLHATRRGRVCTRCMPFVTIRDVDVEYRTRFQRCTTARILVERGKTATLLSDHISGRGFMDLYTRMTRSG